MIARPSRLRHPEDSPSAAKRSVFAVIIAPPLLIVQKRLRGGLILPTRLGNYPEDLDEYFQQDGQWAVAVVGLFQATAMFANTALFDVDVFGPMNIWNALAIAITVVVVGAKRRVLQGAATIIFGVWLSAYIWMLTDCFY